MISRETASCFVGELRDKSVTSGLDPKDPFTIVTSHVAYQNPWIKLEHQDVIRPDGNRGVYGIVRFANRAVAVLPVEDNGDVWLVGQWRRPLDRWSWEVPEGGVPVGEDLEVGARRELEEEAGLIAGSLVKLLDFDVSNCVSDEVGTSYIAYQLTPGTLAPDPTEVLSLRRIHFTHLLAEIDQGLIRDALTLVTVLRAHQLALSNALPQALCQAMLAPQLGA
jgi:ADP-ribose pyrophosphatase